MQPALVFAPDCKGRTRTASLGELFTWLSACPPNEGVAVDTETAGLGWDDPVRLVQFGTSERGFGLRVDCDAGRAVAKQALTEWFTGRLVFHNAPFDMHALERIGINTAELWPRAVDTYVLAHVQDPAAEHGLDALNARWLAADNAALIAGYKKAFRDRMRAHGWTWATVPLLV